MAMAERIAAAAQAVPAFAADVPIRRGFEHWWAHELLRAGPWHEERVWHMPLGRHINLNEGDTFWRLVKDRAKRGVVSLRSNGIMDSRVSISSLSRGRSPARRVRGMQERGMPFQVGSDQYWGLHFGPTRLNTADHPSRGNVIPAAEIPDPPWLRRAREGNVRDLVELAELQPGNRAVSNWRRLAFAMRLGRSELWMREWYEEREKLQ